MINRLPAKQPSKCRPLLFWCCWVLVNPGFSESGLSKIRFIQNVIFLRLLSPLSPDQREIANKALRKGSPSAWRFSSRIAALAGGHRVGLPTSARLGFIRVYA